MEKIKISAVVNTLNEEKNIERCLKSLYFCDQIVVVDMQSDDQTVKLARKYTRDIYDHKRVGYVEPARNFAISKAKGEWILVIDADEEIPVKLANKLTEISNKNEADYVMIPRRNIIFNEWIRHSGWWPDYNIRFFKKGSVTWDKRIHSVPQTSGERVILDATRDLAITHNNYRSISDYILRLDRYTTIQARELFDGGENFSYSKMLLSGTREFCSRYYAQRGFEDGLHGLILATLQGFSQVVVYLKIWELAGFKKKKQADNDLGTGLNKVKKELIWWGLQRKIDKSSFVSSYWYKILRKWKTK